MPLTIASNMPTVLRFDCSWGVTEIPEAEADGEPLPVIVALKVDDILSSGSTSGVAIKSSVAGRR